METKTQTNQAQNKNQVQGYYGNPQVYLNQERGTITHVLGTDVRIEMPVNLYKKILDMPFVKKEQPKEKGAPKRVVFGLTARPIIYVKGDYLIHSVLGIRVSKHVNYYKKILEAFVSQETTASEALTA